MKSMAKVFDIGQWVMVFGSILYLVELFLVESALLTAIITIIYLISLVLILIGWIGTKDERKLQEACK